MTLLIAVYASQLCFSSVTVFLIVSPASLDLVACSRRDASVMSLQPCNSPSPPPCAVSDTCEPACLGQSDLASVDLTLQSSQILTAVPYTTRCSIRHSDAAFAYPTIVASNKRQRSILSTQRGIRASKQAVLTLISEVNFSCIFYLCHPQCSSSFCYCFVLNPSSRCWLQATTLVSGSERLAKIVTQSMPPIRQSVRRPKLYLEDRSAATMSQFNSTTTSLLGRSPRTVKT